MLRRTFLTSAVLALGFGSLVTAAHAEFKLDDRFTDADGDLIADIPRWGIAAGHPEPL